MELDEKAYLEEIEKVIEQFGVIQRSFVMDKKGIHAIVQFIEDFSGQPQTFSLDDPVIQKGKGICTRVIKEMEDQFVHIQELTPPDLWKPFHESLTKSIQLQLEGYKEMAKVFENKNIIHIATGQKLVNEGMSLLEAGTKQSLQK
jgi:hypothetical protein